MSKIRFIAEALEQQTYFTVADILCPTVFYKSPRPFRVGKTYSFSVCICYNYVFFYGYLPLCSKYSIVNAKTTAVFFYGCHPRRIYSFIIKYLIYFVNRSLNFL